MVLVYKTNHSFHSRDLIAVCTHRTAALTIIKEKAEQEGEILTKDDKYNLERLDQTQGYAQGEFVLETVETNVLL
jgi:hypothetical protein